MKNDEQKINCSVHDCKYCNCDCNKCNLEQIKVCNCDGCGNKKTTMCNSYEQKK